MTKAPQEITFGELTQGRVQQDGPTGRGEFTYVDISSIDRTTKRIVEAKKLPIAKVPSRARQILKAGDVLVSMTRPNLNAVAIVPHDLDGAIGSTGFHVLRAQDNEPGYLFYAAQTPMFIDAMCQKVQGALYPAVRPKDITAFPVPRITRSEQRRIVAEIEKQFSRLEEGVGALRRVQANLKRYRAAVLKAACEGQLVPTEAELAKSKKRKFEPGEELLARILDERRKNWQGKGPYKEPAAPNTSKYGPIPKDWVVASLEQLTSPARPICYGILMPKENVATGVLFVTVKDMKGDKIDLESLRRTSPEIALKYARASLRSGDLLLSIRGTYGRVAEVPKELDGGNITQDTARLDVTRLVNHRYVATCLRNPDCQNYFKHVARGVAVKGVNIGDVRPTPIPIPSLAEQSRIVAEVERRLSVVEELEATVEANLQRATRLRQSILQKAVSGELIQE